MNYYCKDKDYPRKNEKPVQVLNWDLNFTDEVKIMHSHHKHPIIEHSFALSPNLYLAAAFIFQFFLPCSFSLLYMMAGGGVALSSLPPFWLHVVSADAAHTVLSMNIHW